MPGTSSVPPAGAASATITACSQRGWGAGRGPGAQPQSQDPPGQARHGPETRSGGGEAVSEPSSARCSAKSRSGSGRRGAKGGRGTRCPCSSRPGGGRGEGTERMRHRQGRGCTARIGERSESSSTSPAAGTRHLQPHTSSPTRVLPRSNIFAQDTVPCPGHPEVPRHAGRPAAYARHGPGAAWQRPSRTQVRLERAGRPGGSVLPVAWGRSAEPLAVTTQGAGLARAPWVTPTHLDPRHSPDHRAPWPCRWPRCPATATAPHGPPEIDPECKRLAPLRRLSPGTTRIWAMRPRHGLGRWHRRGAPGLLGCWELAPEKP